MKLRDRAARQHLHDQSVIEHLANEQKRPGAEAKDPRHAHRFGSEQGKRLLEAIRRRWMHRGLSDF
jgi:hypothetical protein